MNTTTGSSGYGAFSTAAHARVAAGPPGLSGFDILALGAQAFVPRPAGRPSWGSRVSSSASSLARIAGLDGIERKGAGHWTSGTVRGKAELLATVGISVPFLVVFVLGCLTLA
jgi:hypothetical protein